MAPTANAVSINEICIMRGDMMAAIAVERDKGKSKKSAKSIVQKSVKQKLPASFDEYIDAIYANREIPPKDMRIIGIMSCKQEHGIQ